MNEEIKNHVADLAVKLETTISIEMNYRFSPGNTEYSWSTGEYAEAYKIRCDTHNLTKRPLTLNQLLELTVDDFEIRK